MLEKKEKVLEKKAAGELEKAKDFSKAKNKRGTLSHRTLPCRCHPPPPPCLLIRCTMDFPK
jgi:hypothetical protein